MNDREREIARRYLLPEQPFLHGMASAFDLFGVLNRGRSERILANLQADFARPRKDIMKEAWAQVGLSLYHAMKLQEEAERECGLK